MISKSTIYTVLYSFLKRGEGLDGIDNVDSFLERFTEADPTKISGVLSIVALCARVRDDMRSESNKASGKAGVEKALKAVIKNAPAHQPQLQGAFESAGKQTVCDGFRAIRVNEPLDLPAAPVPCTLDIEGLIANAKSTSTTKLTMPPLGELKGFIAVSKAENKAMNAGRANKEPITWDFGEGFPAVDANYLLDILTVFPEASASCGGINNPIYFSHDAGDALLLPVKSREKLNEN